MKKKAQDSVVWHGIISARVQRFLLVIGTDIGDLE